MRVFRSVRWLMLALLLPLIPVSQARASVFISVGFAPPVLPVYVQPPCPEPNLMWVPGYWAYGDDGYYWVPGAWVPAPYEGALWTPPYWGWESGMYMFHPGYWGWHVGYYGGVNYGFGYMGVGFVGGRWDHDRFLYNAAVMHVDRDRIHDYYEDRRSVDEHTVRDERRVAYAGGPGGIHHDPSPEERMAMQERHVPPTQAQQQRIQAARSDRANYFNQNHGRPQQLVMDRPLPAERHAPPPAPVFNNRGMNNNAGPQRGQVRPEQQQRPDNRLQARPYNAPEQRNGPQRPENQPQVRPYNAPERPAPQARPENRPQEHPYNAPQARPEPQQRPQYRPEPQARPEPRPQEHPYNAPQARPEPQQRPQYRPEPQARPEPRPQARPQSRPESRPQSEPRREPKEKPQHR